MAKDDGLRQIQKEHQEALDQWFNITHDLIMEEPVEFRGLNVKYKESGYPTCLTTA